MTPTEEQRAALKRVVAYMDEMYAIASPYHGCTEDANILRAMIDSSEQFNDATKLIGFDLEKARAEVSTASARRFSESREQARIFCAEEILPDALDEIERLRAALDESEQILAHKTKTATHWYEEGLKTRADLVQSKRVVEQQAARLKELESLIESSMSLVGCHQRVIEKREKALVEERARYIDDFIHEFDPQEDRLDEAREQLRAEGKIGPDADAKPREGLYGKYCISKADGSPVDPNADYFVLRLDTDPVARRAAREYSYVTPDRDLARGLQDRLAKYDPQLKDCMNIQFFGLEKPHCWQITEERKAAIRDAEIALRDAVLDSNDPHCWDAETAVLRAMLTEGE